MDFLDRNAKDVIPKRDGDGEAATIDDWEHPQSDSTVKVAREDIRWIMKR